MELTNFNQTQTPFTEKEWKSMERDLRNELVDSLETIEFIKLLTAHDRPRTKDKEKDSKGRIIPDISKPHILEDMDFFRGPAIHFQQYECYTKLYPNKHPQSQYFKFWTEEARRCRDGYIRESDGEWIPGDYYFYLNYSPKKSWQTRIRSQIQG